MIKPLTLVTAVATGVVISVATAALIETLKAKKRWPGITSEEPKQSSENDSVVNAGKGL